MVAYLVLLVAYIAPTLLAFIRHRHNKGAILVLNVLLGWTVIGWVLSLVWAVSRLSEQPAIPVSEESARAVQRKT